LAITNPAPRHPLINAGTYKSPSGSGDKNPKSVEGGHIIVSTGTYWVESQVGPVVKYILATGPSPTLPGGRLPANQIANATNLFVALSIEFKSLFIVAEAALVPTKLIESQVISRCVTVSGNAKGIWNATKAESLTVYTFKITWELGLTNSTHSTIAVSGTPGSWEKAKTGQSKIKIPEKIKGRYFLSISLSSSKLKG